MTTAAASIIKTATNPAGDRRFTIETETGEFATVTRRASAGTYEIRDECGDIHGPFGARVSALICLAECLYLAPSDVRGLRINH